MTPATQRLDDLRTRFADLRKAYASKHGDLLAVVMNATSLAEAYLAVNILAEHISERTLVTAVNLRELLKELPACPFAMPVEASILARAAGLEHSRGAYARVVKDRRGEYELVVLAEGNLCFDVCVVSKGESAFVRPQGETEDIVTSAALDLIMKRSKLLDALVGITVDMGLPVNPRFFLSIQDWQVEHAEEMLSDFNELF